MFRNNTVRNIPGVEIVWMRLHLTEGTVLLGACYLSPETSTVYGRGTMLDREEAAETAFGCVQQDIEDLRQQSDELLKQEI